MRYEEDGVLEQEFRQEGVTRSPKGYCRNSPPMRSGNRGDKYLSDIQF